MVRDLQLSMSLLYSVVVIRLVHVSTDKLIDFHFRTTTYENSIENIFQQHGAGGFKIKYKYKSSSFNLQFCDIDLELDTKTAFDIKVKRQNSSGLLSNLLCLSLINIVLSVLRPLVSTLYCKVFSIFISK